MSPPDPATLRVALSLAVRAPSIHNSQPWRWHVDGSAVDLYADLTRWLPHTDADGRDLLLSCGAALHHLQVALDGLAVTNTIVRNPDPQRPDLLAHVRLGSADNGPRAGAGSSELDATRCLDAIRGRRTDRRRFSDWPVPGQVLDELTDRAAQRGALLRQVTDPRAKHALAMAIHTAALDHDADPEYRHELAEWTGRREGDDGVPTTNAPSAEGTRLGLPTRRFAAGSQPAGTATDDGAVLLVLGTSSDDSLSRLRAGEAASAILLHATSLGLATCPLTEPLEVPGTRELVRDQVLDATLDPQMVLRIGWAPHGDPVLPTPRRSLADQVDGTVAVGTPARGPT